MSVRLIRLRGKKVWQARVAYQGLRASTLRASRQEARDAEEHLRQQLKARISTADAEAQRPATLKMLFEAYVQDLQTRGKSPDRAVETAHVVERVRPAWLEQPISTSTDKEIFEFRQARVREGCKPSTINRDLRTTRAMLKKAMPPEYRFPVGAFFPEDETRVRWLRPEEELLVLEPMRSPFREIAKLAALTLMRLTEVRTLRWDFVHLEQGVVMLPRAKGGARSVILSAAAQKILRSQRETVSSESAWVFPSPDGRPYDRSYVGRLFRKATRGAGLPDFHFHDLRHRGATMALNKGFTSPIVMALGGWKTERMMRRYAAVTDPTLRAAAAAVSGSEDLGPHRFSAPSGNAQWQRGRKSRETLVTPHPLQG